jgi:hypothetical protein
MSAHPACMCKWFGADLNSRDMPQYGCVPQSYAACRSNGPATQRTHQDVFTTCPYQDGPTSTAPQRRAPVPKGAVAPYCASPRYRVAQERHVPQLSRGARLGRARAAAPAQGQGAAHARARILRRQAHLDRTARCVVTH